MAANFPQSQPHLLAAKVGFDVYDNEVYEEEAKIEEEVLHGVDRHNLVAFPLLLTAHEEHEDWK